MLPLRVSDKVLRSRHHTLRLDALDLRSAKAACQQRIFAKGGGVASPEWIARDIDLRTVENIETQRARFTAQQDANASGQVGVECRRERQATRNRGGISLELDSDRPVSPPQSGNVQTRQPRRVTRLTSILLDRSRR